MILVKATKNSESGAPPTPETLEMFEAMGRFNDELEKAGVLVAADGLQPSSKGARVTFSGTQRTVTDGPFAETKELVAGFWIWKCESLEEAIEWVKRCPNPMPGEESDIEIRPIHEFDDFLAEFAPELRKEAGHADQPTGE